MIIKKEIDIENLPPVIYHLAESCNWESIKKQGLLSTCNLVNASELEEKDKHTILTTQRIESVILPNGTLIRDQIPMPPNSLEKCLIDMTSFQWYKLLNSKIFFWGSIDRLNKHIKACKGREQIVMFIDTKKLLNRYKSNTYLTPFNTGNSKRKAARRGKSTFVPYNIFIKKRWETEYGLLKIKPRNNKHSPVEIIVDDRISDIFDYVIKFEKTNGLPVEIIK